MLGFEDVHWAEEPLLDLIEHLADRVDDAPVLVVCLARPELLETRPGWGGGRRRSITIDLGPLPEAETEQLVDALVAGAALPHGVRGALLDKTEGNPLFVEETIRMLAEQGDAAAVRIPDTVQALIASRIDRLPPASRSVVRHGALVGRVFWRGALAELDPELDVDAALVDLVERQLLTREPISTIPGELAFRFRHVLIRDVAYSGLAKGQRARLHPHLRRLAPVSLGRRARGGAGLPSRPSRGAARGARRAGPGRAPSRGCGRAGAAGRRALAREANRTARRLLLRSIELEQSLERRFLAARAAWRLWELPAASVEMEEVRALAHEAGERTCEGLALTQIAEIVLNRHADVPTARRLGLEAHDLLAEAPGDARYEVLTLLSTIGWWEGDLTSVELYAGETLELARAAERADLESLALTELAGAAHARLDISTAEQLLAEGEALADASGSLSARAWAARVRGSILLRRGRFIEAAEAFRTAYELFDETGAAPTRRAHDSSRASRSGARATSTGPSSWSARPSGRCSPCRSAGRSSRHSGRWRRSSSRRATSRRPSGGRCRRWRPSGCRT